jgi:hypothetical protein
MEDDAIQMIDDCEARESQLSEWEYEFISSIEGKLWCDLSEKQRAKLESIWERVTANG